MTVQQLKMVSISLVFTLVVLFGGYRGYQYFIIEKPVKDIIQTQKNLDITNLKMSPGTVEIQLNAKPNYDFINNFLQVSSSLDEKIGQGNWNITFVNPATSKEKKAWQEMVFGVNEGISTFQYSLIPTTVKQIADKYHLDYDLFLDDQYIYLSLRDGNKTWYQILPTKAVK